MMLHKVFLLACLQQGVFLAVRIVHSDRFLLFFFFSVLLSMLVSTMYSVSCFAQNKVPQSNVAYILTQTNYLVCHYIFCMRFLNLLLGFKYNTGLRFFCSQRESKITWQTFLSSSLVVLSVFSHKKEMQFEKDFSECSK